MGEPLSKTAGLETALVRARGLVLEAIAVLDEANAPADIGAHLDLAVHRMRNVLTPE